MATGLFGVVSPPAAITPTVEARGVHKAFAGRGVLDGLDLEIGEGEFIALLGASGSGKTTVLRALANLEPVDAGTVTVPERISVVFQDPRLLPWKRVWRNVTFGLTQPDAKARAADALAEVGLTAHLDAWPATLSGGEAQRVALARALVRQPQLLLLDEPFAALDALTRLRMHGLVAQLCRVHHPATLLVTHDVDEAIMLADRALVLRDGAIAAQVDVAASTTRDRSDPAFALLRARLLDELGVDERAPMHHPHSVIAR